MPKVHATRVHRTARLGWVDSQMKIGSGCWARYSLIVAFLLLATGGSAAYGQGAFNVLTRNYNNQRTGANLLETTLNASNVNSNQFGKLFMLPVDDQVYAAVLYVSGLQIAGGTHNVIYVATMSNTLYAFDADTLGPPLWSRNFNGIGWPPLNTEVGQSCAAGYKNFRGNIGIVGTPVIDGATSTIYFVTHTVESGNTVQRLQAIDIATGSDRPNSPRVIQASIPGSADGGTTVAFNATTANQRAALALSQGVVYIAWGSFCDTAPFHGWVLGYNATSLAPVGGFNTSPNGSGDGIWMAGAGPGFDASGNLYYGTGNGTTDGVSEFGESMVKLSPGSLTLLDYFIASNSNFMNLHDLDFGSSGPTMLPGTTLLASGGKEGKLYLLNTSSLGHQASGDVQIPQVFQAVDLTVRSGATHHIHNNSPAWNSPQGLNLYVWGENDFLHAFRFNSSSQTLTTPPFMSGSVLPPQGMPGGMMTISANGSQSGTGVVWASVPRAGDANDLSVPGNLYAFNAETLALLWSSTGTGDDLLNFSKGSIPVVANGKLYVGSLSKFVEVYGPKQLAAAPQNLALNKTATSTTPCNANTTPDKAFNGSYSGGVNDQWCSVGSGSSLTVDLGASYNISRFVIEHAGAGGETFDLNTFDFNIQVGTDGVNFSGVVNVTGNIDSITTHDIAPTTARYVRLNITAPSQSGDTSARIYEFQVYASQGGGSSGDFSLSLTPGSQTVLGGSGASYAATVTAQTGFSGTVTLSASGLPAGVTASFTPTSVNGSSSSNFSISTSCSTPGGSYPLTVTGTSGVLQHSASATLIVNAASNLCSAYNRIGIVSDGTTFAGGLDLNGFAYSANLLGSSITFQGSTFNLGPPDAPNVVSRGTLALPPGQYSTLALLATGANGNQTSQTFTVTYSDGTTSAFVRSLSDWKTAQNFAGESLALMMPYRNAGNGAKDNRTFNVYAYSLALNAAKTVSSITLPNNNNVVVLAIALLGTPTPDFTMSTSPGSQTVNAGSGTSYTATVTALTGFTGNVTLSATGLPTGATATFNPATVTGAGSSTVTVTTSTSTPGGSYTLTFTGTSGSLQHSATATLVVNVITPDFSISAAPGSQTVSAGGGTTYTATVAAQNGFTASVTLSATGLPAGATATFNPASLNTAGSSTVTITTPPSTPGGSYTLSFTGVSGSLTHSATATLIVNGGGGPANLSSAYNRSGFFTDGTLFSGGLDLNGFAFSANLLGSSMTFQGTPFTLGPANLPNVVSRGTVILPLGQYSNLTFLATGVNGNQTSQTFTVAYTDGTTSPFVRNLSDWFAPQNYAGESLALAMAYRNAGNGTKDNRTFNLYGYNLALNTAKTVSSITLPNNDNVVALAINLTPAVLPDFTITATPASQTVTVGSATTYTTTVTAQNGFSGTVALSATGLPTGVTANFNPASVSTSGSSSVALSTSSSTPPGTYTLTFTGTSGSLQHSATATLIVNPLPDFTMAAAPASQTVIVASGTSYTATVTAQNGFTGDVALTATGLPTGATATFNPPSITNAGSSAVSVSTSSSTPAGTYTLTFTGTSGSLQHSGTATLVVNLPPDFSTAAIPGSQSVTAGLGTSYTATTTALNGFSGNVVWSASGLPDGVTANFNPASVNGSGSSAAGISTSSSTPPGTYTLTFTGTSGSLVHSANTTLVVNAPVPDFSVSATPPSVTVSAGNGTGYTTTITAQNGFSGSVTLSASGLPAGATATFNPPSVTDAGSSAVTIATTTATPPGTYTLTFTGTSGSLQHSTSATLVVTPPPDFAIAANPSSLSVVVGNGTSYTATITAQNGFSGTVALSAGGLPAGATATFNPASVIDAGSSAVSITTSSSTPPGTYTLTFTGTAGALQHSAGATLIVTPPPDFAIGASPSSRTVAAGAGTSYTATITAQNGFSGIVALSSSGLPTGATANFNPASVSGAGSSTVSVSTSAATPPGTYTLTFTGTSGSLQHSASATLIVNPAPDFSITAAPGSQTVTAGTGTSYTATVSAQNGFSAAVILSASGLPTGVTANFNPASVNGAGSSSVGISTLSSTPPGTYTLTFTGTSGSLQHSGSATLVVNPPVISSGSVNLSSVYNRSGLFTDGTTFSGGGLDLAGFGYSATLLGSSLTFQSTTFNLGPPNAPNVVSRGTVPLPPGQYATLSILATGVVGNQTSQTFTVTYSDGTTSPFVRNLSDWKTSQNYAGESVALVMPYRNASNGAKDNRTFNVYAYSLALNAAKTVSSITLPNNNNVVVLAMVLSGTAAPDFTMAASPGSQTVVAGTGTSYTATVTALNGFTGNVALSVTGLPTGATVTFNPASITNSGSSTASITTSAATPPGTYPLTFTGTSGSVQHSDTPTLIVMGSGSTTAVNLSSAYNRSGIFTDGTIFSGGLDLAGFGYSANLLGTSLISQGSTFTIGPANAPNVVSQGTVALPPGQYSTLALLASGVVGNQASQTFIVTYTDSTTSSFTRSLSDWRTSQNFAGESVALVMPYRNAANGTSDNRTFNVYSYSLALNPAKTVASITLPNNGNVVVLAMTLTP